MLRALGRDQRGIGLMAYELSFANRPGVDSLTAETFNDYFQARPRYRVEGSRVTYHNEDTGVQFSFEWLPRRPAADFATIAAASLEFGRPHCFGLEAAPELDAFVKRFELLAFDPQIDGMGRDAFSIDGFLRGWNRGNRSGLSAVVQYAKHGSHTLPSEMLCDIWRWNYGREAYQAQLGDGIFVPKIELLSSEEQIVTAVHWTDGIPVMLPKVDTVLVVREHFAPWKILGGRKADLASVSWSDLEPQLRIYRVEREPWPHRVLQFDRTPEELELFLRKLPSLKQVPEMVAPELVLDRELVDAAVTR